jgi:hypothetical protein
MPQLRHSCLNSAKWAPSSDNELHFRNCDASLMLTSASNLEADEKGNCHAEHSEASAVSSENKQKADPSLCSG